MFYFKSGSKMFFKNIFLSIVLALQIAISIFLIGLTVGRVNSITEDLSIFSGIKQANGMYVMPSAAFDFDEEQIDSYVSDIDNIKTCVKIHEQFYSYDDENNQYYDFLYYDDDIIQNCKLPLEKGKWFTEYSEEDVIPVIVDHEKKGITYGETFELDGRQYKVIGVLNQNSKKYISFGNGGNQMTMSDLVDNFEKNGFLMICPSAYFSKDFFEPYSCEYNFFIIYDDNITEGQISEIESKLNDIGYTASISEMYSAAQKNVQTQLVSFSPYIVITFLLAVLGIGSSVSLMFYKELRNFSVFYICGIPKNKFLLLLPFYLIYLLLLSIAFYYIIMAVTVNMEIVSIYEITMSFKEDIIIILIYIIMFLASIIPTKIILDRFQPIDILYGNLDR